MANEDLEKLSRADLIKERKRLEKLGFQKSWQDRNRLQAANLILNKDYATTAGYDPRFSHLKGVGEGIDTALKKFSHEQIAAMERDKLKEHLSQFKIYPKQNVLNKIQLTAKNKLNEQLETQRPLSKLRGTENRLREEREEAEEIVMLRSELKSLMKSLGYKEDMPLRGGWNSKNALIDGIKQFKKIREPQETSPTIGAGERTEPNFQEYLKKQIQTVEKGDVAAEERVKTENVEEKTAETEEIAAEKRVETETIKEKTGREKLDEIELEDKTAKKRMDGWEKNKWYKGIGHKDAEGKRQWKQGLKNEWESTKKIGRGTKQVLGVGVSAITGAAGLASKVGNGGFFFFMSLLLIAMNFRLNYLGLDYSYFTETIKSLGGKLSIILGNGVIIAILVFYFLINMGRLDWKEYLSFALLIEAIWLLFSLSKSPIVIIHLIFILFVRYIIFGSSEGDKIKYNLIAVALLIFDLFGYSIINYYSPETLKYLGILVITFWIPVSLIYWVTASKSFAVKVLTFIVIFIYVGMTYGFANAWGDLKGELGGNTKIMANEALTKLGQNTKTFFTQKGESVKKIITGQIEYAAGDYYTGNVDKNAKEKLGVYIENLETADPELFEGDDVTIWGILKAKTLDEPVVVNISCFAKSDKEEIDKIKGLVGKEKNKLFNIATFEEENIECYFETGKLDSGGYKVSFNAEFNFTTLAYLKNYLIDKERLRAFQREGIDVFQQYGIKDKNPVAIYTNGPVSIGIGSGKTPVGISLEESAKPIFGVTVENKWGGEIKKINKLIIYIPEKMKLAEDSCDHEFKLADALEEKYKQEGYIAYELADLEKYKIKDIKTSQSFTCRVDIPYEVLGKTPITTKYFKATADYVYEYEESLNINVKTPKGFYVYFEPRKPKTSDEIVCYGKNSEKTISKVTYEIKRLKKENDIEVEEEIISKKEDYCPDGECRAVITEDAKKEKNIKKGDKIKCSMNAEYVDGSTDSMWNIVTIKNSPAEIAKGKIYLFPETYDLSQNPKFSCKVIASDYDEGDLDNLKVSLDVFINNKIEYIEGLSLENKKCEKDETNKVLTCGFEIGKGIKKGDKIKCEASAFDGEEWGKRGTMLEIEIKDKATADPCKDVKEGDSCATGDKYKVCNDKKECVSKCDYFAKKNSEVKIDGSGDYNEKGATTATLNANWGCSCTKSQCDSLINTGFNSYYCVKLLCSGENYCCDKNELTNLNKAASIQEDIANLFSVDTSKRDSAIQKIKSMLILGLPSESISPDNSKSNENVKYFTYSTDKITYEVLFHKEKMVVVGIKDGSYLGTGKYANLDYVDIERIIKEDYEKIQ